MSGINKVILVGNVVNYHEIKHSSSNVSIISLFIATSEWWTDKNTGHKRYFWSNRYEGDSRVCAFLDTEFRKR